MSKNRVSKRRRINCIKCGAEQSTYSSNRQHCHKCVPKCRERHYFNQTVRKTTPQDLDRAEA